MGRKIILLSDGTGNSPAKVWRTNVWRIFESLDLTGSSQVAIYDDGVGTSSFMPAAIIGGAFGFGLKRNVIDLYKFACRNWRNDDDEIFGFGFSRGAFTIRVVVGLILEQGVIRAASEEELNRAAIAAYREYRRKKYHTLWRFPEIIARALRDAIVWIVDRATGVKPITPEKIYDARIRFLGLWDTVAAYGMPVDEMTRGISKWIFPLLLPSCYFDPRIVRACHALSIDDERTTFHPTLWDESGEDPLLPRADGKRYLADERVSQVWFAGVHSNVGGGYPEDSLAHIPLMWIMSEAAAAGLTFKYRLEASPQTFMHPKTVEDKDGRIYDPRSGLGGYYRYGPRDIAELGKELLSRKGQKAVPRIHESVLRRTRNGARDYGPNGLPAEYDVVTSDSIVLSPAQNPYETPDNAQLRAHLQERAWNLIWLKRIVYFATVAASLYLVLYPLQKQLPVYVEYESRIRWLSDMVRMIGAFLPNAMDTWINGYARNPSQLLLAAGAVALFIFLGVKLGDRIQSYMVSTWRRSLAGCLPAASRPTDLIYSLRTAGWYRLMHVVLKRHVAPFILAGFTVYFCAAIASHFLYNVQDVAGLVCRNVADAEKIAVDKTIVVEYRTDNVCQNMKVTLERGGRYYIKVSVKEPFFDGDIEALSGYYFTDPPSYFQRAVMLAGLPLRREFIRPWFRMVARIGDAGGEESFLDPDPKDGSVEEVLAATRDGQLFLFVNDAVIGIPGLYGLFYANNKGSAEVTITRRR
jgi:uncharacterized protein (DUF2235 family)